MRELQAFRADMFAKQFNVNFFRPGNGFFVIIQHGGKNRRAISIGPVFDERFKPLNARFFDEAQIAGIVHMIEGIKVVEEDVDLYFVE